MARDFATALNFGQVGEGIIAKWLQSRGWYILPVYETEINSGKGPRIFAPQGERIIAPDALAMHPQKKLIRFVECKTKTVFSWHRITESWQTGIDLRHWHEYVSLATVLNCDIWILFLHLQSAPKPYDVKHGCPAACPTGLFGQELEKLKKTGRPDTGWSRGMMYWNHDHLVKLAELAEVQKHGIAS